MPNGLSPVVTEDVISIRKPGPNKAGKQVENCARRKEEIWLTLELETLIQEGN